MQRVSNLNTDGIVLVDKPEGPTSHDVVSAVRKIFGTRKVGHAGTLDPMATGMLVLGLGKATRLLGYLAASDKEYVATMRLGMSTETDDAQGTITQTSSADHVTDDALLEVVREFRGPIMQRPSSVSAIKVQGKRAYARVRDGENVEIPAREVVIQDLEILSIERPEGLHVIDVTVRVVCSAGTYIRALARDIGDGLEVGGHLTMLRRTRSGLFTQMTPLEELRDNPKLVPLADALKIAFPTVTLSPDDAQRARHGVRVVAPHDAKSGITAILDDAGNAISLANISHNEIVPVVVFASE